MPDESDGHCTGLQALEILLVLRKVPSFNYSYIYLKNSLLNGFISFKMAIEFATSYACSYSFKFFSILKI
jgi:hypothetical protein